MKIAVLSGKGGTGKTTLSTNLASVMNATYVDCDVEEPNGFIFLKPQVHKTYPVTIPVPVVDNDKCIHCKACVETCQFNALIHVEQVMLFEKLCHGCGACQAVCPTMAILERDREIGVIHEGTYGDDIPCFSGTLNLTEPMAGPIISKLKKQVKEGTSLFDCSPGTSCNVVKGLLDVDYAILVTEPTAFGLHDLKLAVKLVQDMQIPFGIVLNRIHDEDNATSRYCMNEGYTILGVIPYEQEIARLYSRGELLVKEARYHAMFSEIGQRIEEVMSWNS